MASNGKIVYQDYLTTVSASPLYVVPAFTQGWVTSIRPVNKNAAGRTFTIYTNPPGGSPQPYSEVNTALTGIGTVGSAAQVCDNPQEMRLQAGSTISGDASAMTSIVVTIMVGEVT